MRSFEVMFDEFKVYGICASYKLFAESIKIFKSYKMKNKRWCFGLFPESVVPSFSSVSGRGFTCREIWLSKHIFWIAFLLLVLLCFRSRKTHPGPVVHLSDNPLDASKVRWATVVEETLTVYVGFFASCNSVYRVLTFHRPSSNQFIISLQLHPCLLSFQTRFIGSSSDITLCRLVSRYRRFEGP